MIRKSRMPLLISVLIESLHISFLNQALINGPTSQNSLVMMALTMSTTCSLSTYNIKFRVKGFNRKMKISLTQGIWSRCMTDINAFVCMRMTINTKLSNWITRKLYLFCTWWADIQEIFSTFEHSQHPLNQVLSWLSNPLPQIMTSSKNS